MNIELEDLLKLFNQKKDLTIDVGYSIFLNHIREFRRIETYNFHFTYYKSIKRFYDIKGIEYCSQITNDIILKFISYEKLKGNTNSTINKKITHIKYMLDYLNKIEMIDKHKIKIDKLEDDSKRFKDIELKDIIKIINIIPCMCEKYQLQLLLLLNTGIRRNELFNIKLSDLHIQEQYINLSYTKTHQERNIYIDENICKLIQKVSKNNKVYLFENQEHTNHENSDNINGLKKEIYKLCGIKVSPHQFRHTFATQLHNQGYDLETIRTLTGHKDYTMLKRYIHIKNKKLAEISTSLYYNLEHTNGQS